MLGLDSTVNEMNEMDDRARFELYYGPLNGSTRVNCIEIQRYRDIEM